MDTNGILDLFESAAAALAVARLIHLGLRTVFPSLFAWLILLSASNLITCILPRQSILYFWMWVALTLLNCIFSILAPRELFALVFKEYPGIRSVGRRAMYAGILLAFTASVLISNLFQRTSAHGSKSLFYIETSQRSVVFTLAIVIATILFFISRFPLHLDRNTYVSSAFFSILFLSEAARLLIDSLAPYLFNHQVDVPETAFTSLCLISWAVLLRPLHSFKPARITHPNAAEDHLLQQLTALNRMIGRTVRQ